MPKPKRAKKVVPVCSKNAFENVNPDVVNSAKFLSGSNLRVFLTVTLPLSSHAILSGVMMTWARSMGEFGGTLMFAGNLPGITQTMPLAIYLLMAQDPSAAIVLSALMIAFSFSVLIAVKLIERKSMVKKS